MSKLKLVKLAKDTPAIFNDLCKKHKITGMAILVPKKVGEQLNLQYEGLTPADCIQLMNQAKEHLLEIISNEGTKK